MSTLTFLENSVIIFIENEKEVNCMKVRCYIDYDVDVSHLDPKFVDVEGFAVDEALRMLSDEACPDLFTARVLTNEE